MEGFFYVKYPWKQKADSWLPGPGGGPCGVTA